MENAIWSSMLARRVAQALGYCVPDATTEPDAVPYGPEAEAVVGELTETFRYLPLEKVRCVSDFARFLRSDVAREGSGQVTPHWAASTLRELLDFAHFLRGRHGYSRPADESDVWTEEDRRDFTLASQRRLEAEDPWPEGDYPEGEQRNA